MSLHSISLHSPLPLSDRRNPSPELFSGACCWLRDVEKQVNSIGIRCKAISRPRTQEYRESFQNGLPVIKWQEIVDDNIKEDQIFELEDSVLIEVQKRVECIKSMLSSMEDGEISVSAYDTAWVALVEDDNGNPQFPSTLKWITNNQLDDGSWGDSIIFTAHDRIINTLACVIALKSWNIHPKKCKKGMSFLRKNMWKLEKENADHMPIGFEIALPSMLEIARNKDIEIPSESPALQEIYKRRNLKLRRIPKDIMHTIPTTLLHSLEGMAGLDWEKLLKIQCENGSFLFSPSSTAFALMQTKDEKCFNYLRKVVDKFNGGVPNVYPIDLFEHIWAVDRLERLGIGRYFQLEINEGINYIHRYWREEGICWARNSPVQDIDDTAMAFRIMRLHGHNISADVFRHFKKDDEFFCFSGQSTQAVTGMFNLYRASQVQFPGEKILEEAKQFSSKFLREIQDSNEILDKWIITKNLPGEVGYALDVPWYASLARVETRLYMEQYGGADDVWIGKTLYRMPYVSNNVYLELAKLDYNSCQALHRIECDTLQMWYTDCKLDEFGISRKAVLQAYFLAAASIFEPERSKERLTWAKMAVLIDTIESYFQLEGASIEQRRAFFDEVVNSFKTKNYINGRTKYRNKRIMRLVGTFNGTLNHITLDTMVAYGHDISQQLHQACQKWLLKWTEKGDTHQGQAELLIQIINLSAHTNLEKLSGIPQYERLLNLANQICQQLCHHIQNKETENCYNNNINDYRNTSLEIESMRQLVQLVLQKSSDGITQDIKQTFLDVVKTFYYTAHCSPRTINSHIAKVLFQRV